MKLRGSLVLLLGLGGVSLAQPAPDQPVPAPMPVPDPTPAPGAPPAPEQPAAPALENPNAEPPPTATEAPRAGIRVHVLTSSSTYLPMSFDVFDTESHQVVASSQGAIESRGEEAPILDLKPGTYKIVRAGEPFETRVDFAIVTVLADTVSDYMIVVDEDSLQFRASGPVLGELPRGVEIAGLRFSLNGGGTLMFNQRRKVAGTTSGTSAQVGLFANFGLLFDKGDHLFDLSSDVRLDLLDPYTGPWQPQNDHFAAAALYSYKLNNPYFGPYVRGSMRTHIFPGYMYLETDRDRTHVQINHKDGTTEIIDVGDQANPRDQRIRVSDPLGSLVLQEELGANVKAIDLDLLLVKLNVGTRIGFGFRQGIMSNLYVADGSTKEPTDPIVLREVDSYTTLGPVIGANASVTFARWLFGAAQFNALAPVMNTDKSQSPGFGGRLLIDFSGTAGFKVPILTNLLFASADYTFRLERDSFVTSNTQFEHALMARASVTLF